MNVSSESKDKFLTEVVKKLKFESSEAKKIIMSIKNRKDLDQVKIIDDVGYQDNLLIFALENNDGPSILYRDKNGNVGRVSPRVSPYLVEDLIQDDQLLYIFFHDFTGELIKLDSYAETVEYNDMRSIYEEDLEHVDHLLNHVQLQAAINITKEQIDLALQEKDEQSFIEYTNKLLSFGTL